MTGHETGRDIGRNRIIAANKKDFLTGQHKNMIKMGGSRIIQRGKLLPLRFSQIIIKSLYGKT
ncbi:MAG: hypothetical protein B6I30_02505 [Desulfobacteraceae bacterium 4572_187]|nr:MAG: hypothetical protein B6I30_02505 [Desulfobacteraceae bacterium 4572_187]